MPAAATESAARPRRVVIDPAGGPIYVEGPIELCVQGAEPVVIDRFLVALCSCRRSAVYPLCDSSHRRARPESDPA